MTQHSTLTAGLAALTLITATGYSNAQTLQSGSISIGAPAMMQFGASLEAMRAGFEDACGTYDIRVLDPADLPIATTSHVQVDCQGFEHAGAARLAEFVFADDALAFVWVLTEAGEEAQLHAALVASYGAPTHEVAAFIAYADDHLALRRDVPELLYYGSDVAEVYRDWFNQMAAR